MSIDFPELSSEQLQEQMFVIDTQGNARGGAVAVRYLSRKLPLLWPLALLLHIPGTLPLWNWLYAFVAKRRLWIAGKCDDAGAAVVSKNLSYARRLAVIAFQRNKYRLDGCLSRQFLPRHSRWSVFQKFFLLCLSALSISADDVPL